MEILSAPPQNSTRDAPTLSGWEGLRRAAPMARRSPFLPLVGLCILLAGHFAWLASQHVSSAIGPDAHDYLAAARLLAEQHTTSLELKSPLTFIAPQWFPALDTRYHSVHDMGLSYLMGAVRMVLGNEAVTWVNPILVSMVILGFFLWCRQHTGPWLALMGAVMLATLPPLNQSAVYGDSHPLATAFLIWALVLVDSNPCASVLRMLLTGVLLGAFPVIRSADTPAAMVVGVFAMLRIFGERNLPLKQRWLRASLMGAAAAIPIALHMWNNTQSFGGPLKNAYTVFGGGEIFSIHYVARNAYDMAILLATGSQAYLVWPGLAGLVVLIGRRALLWQTSQILAIILANLAIYLPYYWPVQQGGDRFYLPIYLMLAASLVFGLRALAEIKQGWTTAIAVVAAVAAVIAVPMGGSESQRRVHEVSLRDHVLQQAMRLLQEKVPRNAIVISDYAMAQEIDAEGGWQAVDIGRLVPRQARRLLPRSSDQPKPISRQLQAKDDWIRTLNWMSSAEFDRKALPELKSLAQGKAVYVLALTPEWKSLPQRWEGNWSVLGSLDLPQQELDTSTNSPVHPNNQGKLYDLVMDGGTIDLVKANLW